MEFKDYYATLGVTKTATDKEIKQAFRKLARKYHPDVNPGDKAAETRFKEINEANEVLGDPEKRRKYDELGANWRGYENVPPGGAGLPGGFGGFRGPAPALLDRQRRPVPHGHARRRWKSSSAAAAAAVLRLLHDVLRRRRRGRRRRERGRAAARAAAPAPMSSTRCSSRSKRRFTARYGASR